jgi:nicotinamide mononucleotide transporter
MLEWINNNCIEITGAIFSFIYLILEIKRKWLFWVVGIISSSFYIYIFYHSGLYAEMGLNFYYIIMSVYGLYCWKFASKSGKEELGFHRIRIKTAGILFMIFIVLFAGIILVLYRVESSNAPVADALIAILSIIGTWMAAKKIVECWYIWIFVNIFATGLYFHQNLYPTAILFTVYSILSFVGLREWLKTIKKNDTTITEN